VLLSKIKKIPKNTNGRLAIPALAGLLVYGCDVVTELYCFTVLLYVCVLFYVILVVRVILNFLPFIFGCLLAQ